MFLDRLQAELTEDRHELGQRGARPAEVHAKTPVVALGVDRPPERGRDRARSEECGDLPEVGHRVGGPVARPVFRGRRSGDEVEDPLALAGPERVDRGTTGLFIPGLRDPIDRMRQPFEVDVVLGPDAHRHPGERTRADEGLRIADVAAVVLGHECGDLVGQRRGET